MDVNDETIAPFGIRQTLGLLRALHQVQRPDWETMQPGMPSPQQVDATLLSLGNVYSTSRDVVFERRWPLRENFHCFAQIDTPNFFERKYPKKNRLWDNVRLRQLVCPVWAGYQPPAGMPASHIITKEDHFAYCDALDEHTEDYKKIAEAIKKPQGVVSIYIKWLYHFRGLQIEYGHILHWRDDLWCNEEEIEARLRDYYEQLAAGTWERDYAPVYLHEAFKKAGGGRVPTELLPLYAGDPLEADARAAKAITAERAMVEDECEAGTDMLLNAFMGVTYDGRSQPWKAMVFKGTGFCMLQACSAHAIEAAIIADGALRKKHGADARTALELQLVPRYKQPRAGLREGVRFMQGPGRGNQTDDEKKLIKMKIYSFEQFFVWKTTGRIPAYSHMKPGSEAVKWLLRHLARVVANAPAPPSPAFPPAPLPPAPVPALLAAPPHAQRRHQSPPQPQQQQQQQPPRPSSSSFINPFQRQQPPRPSSLVAASQPQQQQQQQQPQQPDPLGTSSLASGGGPRPPPTPAAASTASLASAAAAPAAAAAPNDDDGDDEWVPFADLSIAAPAPTASNATGKTAGEDSEWMEM